MRQILAQLAALTTRRDAAHYLAELHLNKRELLELARHLDVAADRRDTLDTIRRKIVDSTVGVREDAAAIRRR